MIEALIRRPATLTRTGRSTTEFDDYNQPIETTETANVLCYIQPVTSAGSNSGRSEHASTGDIQTETHIAFLLPDADVDGWDRIAQDGISYEFDGPPALLRHPVTQVASHYEARLRRSV